ncbi:Lrp/AsnC family transcriptional regulator, regulator for asnA, asnC and gidA [Streptomyces sp. 1222.5]|uniref:Lrp/AsnC family transcriptional regulator n=1 Tax=unclassified Streptomyces TaxID=2593676 RepID=UPI00089D0B3A|nr:MULTISPECIES: Lrp/AsnC family transcriptional regulator [unclassified Streptomyces]PKW05783.1 Lrp/AsnC family transcriptional regulator for asnA, asnC and gidA [Streptomyces sp. 5112.2]SEC29378.1 Lrp/AsnC family transcriptional regulator, regulator for asnA, asnC and gidA [Streptomyces sp. 2231.1]SED28807.1 Lrp/AsnC family transcriptional regulator, regulator for asnA, asnC and gidA [Streptomyces sp. 1222.5]
MDEIDRAILRELQTDGRIAYADLGPKVGLSASAARQRLQRLLDSRAVQVVGVTDPMAMGGQAMALLGIRADGDPRTLADALAERPEVVYSVLTSGGFDLFAEVVAPGPKALLDFVNDVVRPIDGVREIESFPYFGIHTHRFLWDVG